VATDGTKIHKHAVSWIIIHLFIFYKLLFRSEDYNPQASIGKNTKHITVPRVTTIFGEHVHR